MTAAAILISCSVKEERGGCPCRLEVDISEASPSGGIVSSRIETRESVMTINTDPATESLLTADVPKGYVNVTCIQGIRSNRNDGTDVIIPEGFEADSIMVSLNKILCSGENASCKAMFHKNWATLTILEANEPGRAYPYDIHIRGNINGLRLLSGKPLEGSFHCEASRHTSEGTVLARIPRQKPDGKGLTLELVPFREDGIGKVYDLSDLISSSGYDWTTEDLNDIRLYIDHAGCLTGIRVIDWKTGEDISIVI